MSEEFRVIVHELERASPQDVGDQVGMVGVLVQKVLRLGTRLRETLGTLLPLDANWLMKLARTWRLLLELNWSWVIRVG